MSSTYKFQYFQQPFIKMCLSGAHDKILTAC
nr:MAG TPA: hypothetical protein [Caudoviricetes sp.]